MVLQSIVSRNVIFGIQDAVTTTIGFLFGVYVGKYSRDVIVKTAFITVVVSSMSMAIGTYQSERSVQLNEQLNRGEVFLGATTMFFSYLLTGLLLLLPIRFMRDEKMAFACAISLALACLAIAGYAVIEGDESKKTWNGAETAGLGLLGVLAGFLAGKMGKTKI